MENVRAHLCEKTFNNHGDEKVGDAKDLKKHMNQLPALLKHSGGFHSVQENQKKKNTEPIRKKSYT